MARRKLYAVDCETDPFKHNRIPVPFVWGAFDGTTFEKFYSTESFIERFRKEYCFLYAHNGGKFDFMFLLDHIEEGRLKVINGRIAEMKIGEACLRDSFCIIPTSLASYQKTAIEYWKMEREHRDKHMPEIIDYLRDDCVNLFDLVSSFRANAGKQLTIASNALTFAKKQGANIQRTTQYFDGIFRDFYFGGRCEALQGGSFNDIEIYDIKSAYPFAMMHNHPHGNTVIKLDSLDGLTKEQIEQSFITIECYADGCFPIREKQTLAFPRAQNVYHISGWEYLAAKAHNLIKDDTIISVFIFDDSINFQDYVSHWFSFKDAAEDRGDKVNRHIGKIMLNSLYGKLCQNPEHYKDYKVMPLGSELEEGWELGFEIGNKELHWRPSLWHIMKELGDDWRKKPKYYNVATGASITGFVRAMLINAIETVGSHNALYVDTDCIFVKSPFGKRLNTGTGLGEWAKEGFATECHIGGKKLYCAKLETGKEKMASKGARLDFNQIKRVCHGEVVRWFNDAPTFKLDGTANFIYRNIRATAQNAMQRSI